MSTETTGCRVGIIPARGGSKRIPHKNIRPFCGKPMIAYPITAAWESGCFDRVLVSTDDPEVAGVARDFGAETPFLRPAELSDDATHIQPVMCHAIRWLQDRGAPVSWVCQLFATAPFLRPEDLREGFARLSAAPDKRFSIAVTDFPFPVQRAIRVTPGGGIEPLFPEYMGQRSQDLELACHDAGQFIWGRPEAFLQQKSVFSKDSIPIRLPRYRVQDIDTMEDWEMAELLFITLAGGDRHERRVSG